MKVEEVFTPICTPSYTYVDRISLEETLRVNISSKSFIISLYGSSKSGKTVLCETLIEQPNRLWINCADIHNLEDFWVVIRRYLKLPNGSSVATSKSQTTEMGAEGTVGINIGLAKGESKLLGKKLDTDEGSRGATFDGVTGSELLDAIREANKILIVDDFHYLDSGLQRFLAREFKVASHRGLVIILISIMHHGDDLVMSNLELAGRVVPVEIPLWENSDLELIAKRGFNVLRVKVLNETIARIAFESLHSPSLIQALCLELSLMCGIQQELESEKEYPIEIFIEAACKKVALATPYKVLVPQLLETLKPGILAIVVYKLFQGSKVVDIFQLILRAISSGEPKLIIPIGEITLRINELVSDPPEQSQIEKAVDSICDTLNKITPEFKSIEWNAKNKTFNIFDPYFLYYLRWAKWL
jgi:hypothetical protein